MRGAAELIEMRRKGYVPGCVMLHITAEETRPLPGMQNRPDILQLSADSNLDREDWRCLVGLKVCVVGGTEHRHLIPEVCMRAFDGKAALIVGFCTDGCRLTRDKQVFGEEWYPWPK